MSIVESPLDVLVSSLLPQLAVNCGNLLSYFSIDSPLPCQDASLVFPACFRLHQSARHLIYYPCFPNDFHFQHGIPKDFTRLP